MTDNTRGAGGPIGPPWSVDVLADLHAGLLPEAEAARLWPRVTADPQARAVLDALESVRTDLNHFGSAPVEPMPAQFAARLDAAIQTEMRTSHWAPAQQKVAPVVSLDEARKRRNRRLSWGAGVFAAAAAALAITVAVLPSDNTTQGDAVAGDKPTSEAGDSAPDADAGADRPPLALSGSETPPVKEFSGEPDYGPFGTEQAMMDCIDAHGVEHGDPIGAREVTLDGKEGVAALLGAGSGKPGQFKLVIVSPDCTGDDPGEMMAESTIGR